MSIEALKKRKLNILGIVFNNMPGENKVILEDNCKIIKELSGEGYLGFYLGEKTTANYIKISPNSPIRS